MTLAVNYYLDNSSNTIIDLPRSRNNKHQDLTFEHHNRSIEAATTYISPEVSDQNQESAHTTVSLPFTFNFEYQFLGSISKLNVDLDSSSTATDEFNTPKKYLLLKTLVNDYLSGEKDIPDLIKMLGDIWTENNVILLLESLGVSREPFFFQVSEEDEEFVLNKLAQISASSELAETYNQESWIRREVAASQRIESIYVFSEDFPE